VGKGARTGAPRWHKLTARAVPTRWMEAKATSAWARRCTDFSAADAILSRAFAHPTAAEVGYDRPFSSRKACTASNSIRRFFSMMMVWVPSGSWT
jgi:hypothetical protein